jgi:farnesyl diphosphate synthase
MTNASQEVMQPAVQSVQSFDAWMAAVQATMEQALSSFLPDAAQAPQELHQAMRYAALDGGKRVRPLLAFAAGELFAAAPQQLQRAAAAVEMIHAYSLVHDDMPCMDDDALRRGKPTVHVKFGQASALLIIPVILVYTVWAYYIFRGKVRHGEGYH